MSTRGDYTGEVERQAATRAERERLLTALAEELSRYSPHDPAPVILDNLWGWLMWQRQKGKP